MLILVGGVGNPLPAALTSVKRYDGDNLGANVGCTIYESDPGQPPDTDFVPGRLRNLVVGNSGRLLDARRTPVMVTAVDPDLGAFEVEIQAFEDAGARWQLPLDDVGRFQFARGAGLASPAELTQLEHARARFARTERIECDPAAREKTARRLADERAVVRNWLARHSAPPRHTAPPLASAPPVDLATLIARRTGDQAIIALLDSFLAERGLDGLDRAFSKTFVSNPRSGEVIKGHAIVLAELGLCPYHGQIVRDPRLFREPWSRALRAEHIIARLAFVQELWSSWKHETVTLYRGAAVDGPLPAREQASFVSATFSSEVAAEHFEGGPTTQTAVMWRQRVPVGRLFMTFVETSEMNGRFNEAEALLIGDPANHAF